MRNEAGFSKCRVQLQIEPGIQQISLPVLQLENKALVIILGSESTLF